LFTGAYSLTSQLSMILWPIITVIILYQYRKQVEKAVLFCFAVAMCFLPEKIEFDMPAVPPINKEQAVLLVVLVFFVWRYRKRIRAAKPGRGLDVFVIISMIAAIGTAKTNPDWLAYGSWITTHIRGLTLYDSISLAIRDLVGFGLPFFVGRMAFKTTKDAENLFRMMAGFGLFYTLFCLVEIRLSPQLHTWIYGYAQHSDFAQTIRWGGFRPMVFMAHGLAVGMFMCASTMSASLLGRMKQKLTPFKLSAKAISWFLGLILLACKSTGAIFYGALFVPVIAKFRPKNVVRVAIVVAMFVAIYPTLRATRVFPAATFVAEVQDVLGAERAQSMAFRFDNEELLLDKAFTRIWFGWGGEGRGRVYDEEMGKELTIADGWWIIVLSSRGAIGAVCNFAVLLLPIFAMRKKIKKIRDRREQELIAGLTLLLAVYTLDLVPNGAFTLIPFLLAGALHSISNEMVKGTASLAVPLPAPSPRPPLAAPYVPATSTPWAPGARTQA
jgi:hypothetical protein